MARSVSNTVGGMAILNSVSNISNTSGGSNAANNALHTDFSNPLQNFQFFREKSMRTIDAGNHVSNTESLETHAYHSQDTHPPLQFLANALGIAVLPSGEMSYDSLEDVIENQPLPSNWTLEDETSEKRDVEDYEYEYSDKNTIKNTIGEDEDEERPVMASRMKESPNHSQPLQKHLTVFNMWSPLSNNSNNSNNNSNNSSRKQHNEEEEDEEEEDIGQLLKVTEVYSKENGVINDIDAVNMPATSGYTAMVYKSNHPNHRNAINASNINSKNLVMQTLPEKRGTLPAVRNPRGRSRMSQEFGFFEDI